MINAATHIMGHLENPLPPSKAAGRKRDQILSGVLAASTFGFLQNFNFEKGMAGLDLGCGVGDTTLQLQNLVGRNGNMTGIDASPVNVSIAREKVALKNKTNIQFFQKDIATWNENEQYGFVYSRLLFNQLSRPQEVLQQIFQSLKKGGWVMIEDWNLSNCYCCPSCYAFERHLELLTALKKRRGADTNMGSRFGPLLRKVNFEHVQVQRAQPVFLDTESKHIPSLSLENTSDALLAEQLTTASELQALLFELKTFENRPDTLITLPGMYQVVGYRLEGGDHPVPQGRDKGYKGLS